MTPRGIHYILSLALMLVAAQGLLAQGLYFESVYKGGPFEGEVSRTYLMPKMMKLVSAKDEDFVVIRLDWQKVVNVSTKDKTYWEKTFAEMEQSAKAASEEMEKDFAELKEKMKEMPEEQRKMMEQMMGPQKGGQAGAVEMNKTGETKKISGFDCTKYEARQGTQVLMTIWATKEVKGFEPLRKDYEELWRRMTSMNPRFVTSLVDAILTVEGFPVETDWAGFTTTVTKVERRSTPESEFAVPGGYTKIEEPKDSMKEEEEQPENEEG